MMRSPKNRKGKKVDFSAPVAAMFLIAAVLGMQFGCTDTKTAPAAPQQTGIEKAVYGAISGVVHDLYTNQALRGVKVSLEGVKQRYTASTDKNGHFRINNVYLGTVTGLSGGAGLEGGNSETQTAELDFPLFFDTNSYAPWKERVALSYEYIVDNGTIVIPSGTFFEVGRTGLMPYVQSFTGKVWAGQEPAKGVTVMLDHTDFPDSTSDWPDCRGNCPDCNDNNCEDYPDYVQLVNSFAVTNDEGIFTFNLDDRVVAYSDYEIVVYPYDLQTEDLPEGCDPACDPELDPECVPCDCLACAGDGHYEYDTTENWLNLEPKPGSHFDLVGYDYSTGSPRVVQTADYAINLKDAENDLEVIYCSLQASGNALLPENYNNFSINVIFNRPVTAANFKLYKDGGSQEVAKTVQQTGAISYNITPIDRLNAAGNTWRFRIMAAEDYMGEIGPYDCYDTGGGSGCIWDFNVAGFVPPVGPMAPWIDVNTGGSQTFDVAVPDRRVIYRLYKDFGPTDPNSVLGVMQSGADLFPWLNVAFNRPAAAVGVDSNGYSYYAYVRDTHANTAWVQRPVESAFDDGQQVEGSIYLPPNFMYSAGGDNSYLGDGNQIWITILAVNEDGSIDPSQLEGITADSYLVLGDSWGPMIVGSNTSIYGANGTVSADDGTLYDERANVAYHEVLDGSVVPTATTSSANFSVTGVFMDEKHTFVTAEFAPTVTATLLAPAAKGTNILVVDDVSGFYPGDDLALYLDPSLSVKTEGSGGPSSPLQLDGYDDTTNILSLNRNLSADHAAGEVVAMLGPMQQGVDAGDWATALRESTQDTAGYIAVAPDALGNLPGQMGPSKLIVNGQEIRDVTAVGVPTGIASPLLNAYVAGTPVVTAIAGYGDSDGDCCDVNDVDTVANTVLLQPAAGGDQSIMVEDGSDIAVGDWLQVGEDDYVKVASVEPGTDTEATVTFVAGQMLHYSYPARLTPVVELTAVSQSVTLLAYPLIDVNNGIDDLLPGAAVSISDPNVPENVYNATVLSTYDAPGDNNWIGLSNLAPEVCEGACQVSDFPIGSVVSAPANTRTADSIQINVTDTSGNNSLATDKDGDGQADFDELELWYGGQVK